jgi:hypothetical protein
MAFYIVHPYTDEPDRLLTATVVRSFDTAAQAFAEIDRLTEQLRRVDFRVGVIELLVLNEHRHQVHRGDAYY